MSAPKPQADQARFDNMLLLIALASDEKHITGEERASLRDAQAELCVNDEQMRSLEAYVATWRMLRQRGADQKATAKALKRAAVRLRAVGIPIRDLGRPGLLARRLGAGITAGLAFAGLGLGMGAGLGLAIGLGAVAYRTTFRLCSRSGQPPTLPAPGAGQPHGILASLYESRETAGGAGHRAIADARKLDAPVGPRLCDSEIRAALQDADVLMFRGTHVISRLLQAGARSSYSHCGLVAWWHRRAMLLQAHGACIQAVPLSVVLHDYRGEVDWYQIRPEYRARVNVNRIIEEAQANLGLAYATADLLRNILNDVTGFRLPQDCEHPRALFCSQYVARCFRLAGLPLQPQRDIATFPSEIALSPVLHFVGTIVPNLTPEESRATLDRGLEQ